MSFLDYGIVRFSFLIGALLITLVVHESAHALVAYYLGDPTAKLRGRISLNPKNHLDTMGSVVFLLTQKIGWGKPVPVNPANFKNPVRDSGLTALAGPVSNFLLALFLAVFLKYFGDFLPFWLGFLLTTTLDVSIYIGLFNLLPIPPLDGSKILGLFVPSRFHYSFERFLQNGMKYFVVIILIDVFILPELIGYSIFGLWIGYAHDFIRNILFLTT